MNSSLTLYEVVVVEITDVKIVGTIVQMHSEIDSGIFKAKTIHKTPTLVFRYDIALTIWLLDYHYKLAGSVPTKAKDLQRRINEDCIVYHYAVQCQTQDIVVL